MRPSLYTVALLLTQGLTLSLPEGTDLQGLEPPASLQVPGPIPGEPRAERIPATRVVDVALEKRAGLLELFGAFVRATLYAAFPVEIGVYTWSGAIWNTAKRCFESTFDCLYGVADAVFGVWRTAYTAGNAKRDVHGNMVYAYTDVDDNNVHLTFHVPFGNHKRLVNVLRNDFTYDGNHTFRHLATVYQKGVKTLSLHHRFAHPDDLGHENDGSFHHIRALPDSETVVARVEKKSNHVVGDYLWRHGNSELFNDIHNEKNIGNAIGSSLANWMEKSNSEATCASIRTYVKVSEGGPVPRYENQGVFAYGWNDKPFNFQGKAGSWIEQCE